LAPDVALKANNFVIAPPENFVAVKYTFPFCPIAGDNSTRAL